MLKLEKIHRRVTRINRLRGAKPMSIHYGMNAKTIKYLGVYKVYEEPVELTMVRMALDFEVSFRKGFNPNKRYTFGE